MKDVQGSLDVDKVCARSSHAKLADLIDNSLRLELVDLFKIPGSFSFGNKSLTQLSLHSHSHSG